MNGSETGFLEINNGKIAFQDYGGNGDLVLLLPGIGEMRGSYRYLAPLLVESGYHVIAVDNRGQGESSADWKDYSIASMGKDTIALIEHLGSRPVHLVGNSKAASTVVWVAINRPELVRSLVLIGPFVRETPISFWTKAAVKVVTLSPLLWDMYYRTLYATRPPKDLDQYRALLKKNLSEPGRMRALREMTFAASPEVSNNLGNVKAKTLVVMGTKDHDFKDPASEAEQVALQMHGEVAMIEGAGHYPQGEYPRETASALAAFFG